MKRIGLIGGLSWESTVTYYNIINEEIRNRMGGLHSADMIIRSLDFAYVEKCQRSGEWDRVAEVLKQAALDLERAGAQVIAIASNTVHNVVPEFEQHLQVPILHIADVTAVAVKSADAGCVGLLGTKYTMEGDFLKERLINAGVEVVIPDSQDIEKVNRAIFEEACAGEISAETKAYFAEVVKSLQDKGAQGIVLGCTELDLILEQQDFDILLFDTTEIHAKAIVELALKETR